MKIIKISLIFRSIDTLYDYKAKKHSLFWDDYYKKIGELCGDFSIEARGTMSNIVYFPAFSEPDEWAEKIRGITRSLLGGDADFLLTASLMSESDAERLRSGNIGNITSKTWFSEFLSGKSTGKPVADFAEGVQLKTDPPSDPEGDGEKKPNPPRSPATPKKADRKDPDPTPEDLAGEAERIIKLKEDLLKYVRGQRHAVEEVVQTVFECDAFAAHDESRKGPLAVFLFVGPSGVGKTYLARCCGKMLRNEDPLVVDMSEFSDNLSNNKFNGDHGEHNLVTGYVREHPNGIIIFDEIEKAHINTIHLFLQILDQGELTDMKLKRKVSFRNTIIFITTNAGQSLYEDTTVTNLSGIPRKVILEALRTDINPTTREPFFPECITTRFANGHVVLFNHLEPFALSEIVRTELELQVELFRKKYNVDIEYDPETLSALILYNSGGVADARTLRGNARRLIVNEVQSVVMQIFEKSGKEVNRIKNIRMTVDPDHSGEDVRKLFEFKDKYRVTVFSSENPAELIRSASPSNFDFACCSTPDEYKKMLRGVVDFALVDPLFGLLESDRNPNDIEDVKSQGMEIFRYLQEYYPDTPVYLLDTEGRGEKAFDTLLASGARDVIPVNSDDVEALSAAIHGIAAGALMNNNCFALGRSGKMLNFNCSQYSDGGETAVVSFDNLSVDYSPSSADRGSMARKAGGSTVTFNDVIGARAAKAALRDFCKYVSNPKEYLLKGEKIPRGILLYGPPGTGKTMLAKALANEADAAFFPTSATSFFAPYVGQSEGNVREIWRKARKYAPSILFIDEVDAIGRLRTGSISTAHNEDVLNAFLAEMDGFSTDDRRPVFVIAATNYGIKGDSGRVLDPAFVRRFDRHILVDLPDCDERFEFLNKRLADHGVSFGDKQDELLRNVAERSGGMSCADLENVVNNFLRATSGEEPTGAALISALDTFRFGEVNKIDPAALRQTACHESGHALVSRILGSTPSFLTVVSRGNFGGFMEHSSDELKPNYTYNELMNRTCCALAGRAAEITVYGEDCGINTGAASDIEHARYYVKIALDDYAMGEFLYRKSRPTDGETLMREQFDRAVMLLSEHRETLDRLTDLLCSEKSLDKKQLDSFFEKEKI